jgi:hypothetical protein
MGYRRSHKCVTAALTIEEYVQFVAMARAAGLAPSTLCKQIVRAAITGGMVPLVPEQTEELETA